MSKPQPKEEPTILLDEDNTDEDLNEIRSPYRERIYRDSVRVLRVNTEDEKNAPTSERFH